MLSEASPLKHIDWYCFVVLILKFKIKKTIEKIRFLTVKLNEKHYVAQVKARALVLSKKMFTEKKVSW